MNKKALIQKFLNNEADPAEAARALQYLKENPELLEEFLPESEWDAVAEQPIPLEVEELIRKEVLTSTKPFRISAYVKPWAVAASVLAVVASLFLFNRPEKIQPQLAAIPLSVPVQERVYDTLFNTGSGQMTIVLDDGSKVQLFGHSSLVVPVSMESSRALQLYGKAIFHVSKNPKLPFTVKSGAISTTALGTIFLVDATPNQSTIHVALYEGKVVVKSVDYTLDFGDTYLNPGEQCQVNLKAGSVAVSSIQQLAIRTRTVLQERQVESEMDPITLNFVKVPLSRLFYNLERRFEKTIRLDTSLVQSQLFTGSFKEEDSLYQILQVIGTMNGLEVVPESNGFALLKEDRIPAVITANELLGGLLPKVDSVLELVPVSTPEIAKEPAPVLNRITKTPDGEYFRKMTLSDLFDHLQQKHKIRIIYNKDLMQGLSFTGTLPDDQSYINMLQIICRMNELKLHKMKRGTYSVEPGK